MKKFLIANAAALMVVLAGTSFVPSVSMAQSEGSREGMGLFVEPGVTYERGNTRTDWPLVRNDSTGESNGLWSLLDDQLQRLFR